NGIERPHAAALWLRHLYAALAADPGALVVVHRDLFGRLRPTLRRITDHLGVAPPSTEEVAQIRALVDPELRHHVDRGHDRGEGDPVTQLAEEVWNDGDVQVAAVDPLVGRALAEGW